jgi:hypothetical protein
MAVTQAPQYDSSNSQSDTYIGLQGNYVGRLNHLHEAVFNQPIKPLVDNVNKLRLRTGQRDVSDVNSANAWYLFNGHPIGLRFSLCDELIVRVTYAFKGEQPVDLKTSEILSNPAIIRTLEDNKASLDSLVGIILKAAKAIT